ncbi:MAG: NAD-dependent epimerase/dehydratase family protein [Mycobacterium sp.]
MERFVTVDIGDQAAVQHAMVGCDAVFHAAAAVSLGPHTARESYDNNVVATKTVLGAASTLGIDNLLHVSSLTALFQPGLSRVDESTPLAEAFDAYSRSKRDSDEYVRGLQQRGVPVQITYPSAVIGPDDPKLSAGNRMLASWICRLLPRTTTGFQGVDVRDLAQAHCWLLEHPFTRDFERARYIVGGRFYPWGQLHQHLEALLGRPIFSPRLSPGLLGATSATVDRIKKLVPFETQISTESMAITTRWSPASSSRFLEESGLRFRPGEETFGDTIRWMVAAGHIPLNKAGRLGGASSPALDERCDVGA